MVKYKHFKGGIYEYLFEAKSSDNLELYVVYKSEKTGEIWIRRKEEFFSKVDKTKYPNIKQEYRFEKINE